MLEDATNQQLLAKWQQGSEAAAAIVVRRYMQRLIALVRGRLSRKLARRIDPEDVVLSAWRSFFVAVGSGRAAVPGGDDLWPLLVTISLRKLARQANRNQTQSRDVASETATFDVPHWQEVVATDPTPEAAATLADDVESLMSRLTPIERAIVSRRLRGDEQATIAEEVGCSTRTVKRAMQRAREHCEAIFDAPLAIRLAENSTPPPRAIPPSRSRPIPTVSYSDFRLEQMIGQGRFGRVYRARTISDGALVAVKALRKSFWKDARAVAALHNEHEVVATLSSPHIVKHLGWGVSPHGAMFLVMEWVEGANLLEGATSGSFSATQTIRCGRQIAAALEIAHAAGVIHGDVTPGNILRAHDGDFRLADFGFAKSVENPLIGHLGGTPGFLAPEQVSEDFGLISERTDVYGLGGVLHFLLTGKPPFDGTDTPESLAEVLSSRSAEVTCTVCGEIPADLARLVNACLQKEPSNRLPSMKRVVAELQLLP